MDYQLTGRLTYSTVESLWADLESYLAGRSETVVDCSALERVNSAGLSFLLHCLRWQAEHAGVIRLAKAPGVLVDLAKMSGLGHITASLFE